MFKTLLHGLVSGTLIGASILAVSLPLPAHSAPKALVCTGDVTGGTYFSVRVPAGESCTLTDAKVTHGVHARQAANVSLIDTDVARNVNIRGTTGLTEIKQAGCGQDPVVGNNLTVRNSHDVLICQVHAKNNIRVVHNDGMITVRDSVAGNNIAVNRNLAFVPNDPPTTHVDPDIIRIFRSTAGNHIHVFHNDRRLRLLNDSPTPVVK